MSQFLKAFWVMAGPDEWGCEAKFRQAVRQASAGERVIFPGMVSGEAKIDLLARADLFCLPSDAEGFFMAVLEALASATPVLLSSGCHFPELERVGAGRVVAATHLTLAEALTEMLNQPEELNVIGKRGLALTREHYSWDHIND